MAIDVEHLRMLPPRIVSHRYTAKDTMLYALGVGAGQDAAESGDLRFVYEDGLQALPTMAVVLAYPGFWQKEPAYGIDWPKILHAEQSVRFHAPLPAAGDVRGEMTIDAIVDKGAAKGALLIATRRVHDAATGALLASVRQTSFLRGDGGRGGFGTAPAALPPVPDGEPDAVIALQTRPEQAMLYRLSGDDNPLHVDPRVAAQAGLPRPVLHGLCTYGIVGRALLNLLCGDEPARLLQLDCRFTAPVFPGAGLALSVWRVDDGRGAFRVRCDDAVVIDQGQALFAG